MMLNDQQKAAASYCKGVAEAWNADELMTVSEWADAHRILPSKGAAEPGPYRTSRTPYMREIMDSLSATSPVQDVIFMAGAQVGKSEGGNNWIGYVIDHAPGPMLMVQPTVDGGKRYSKQRIAPMINECPRLTEKILDNKSRENGNTMLEKEFPGGMLIIAGANSAAGLRSMPIRYLMADELSNWPHDVDGEGDPLELASARTTTFARRKIYKCSTPSIAGVCRIENEYLNSDRRKYHVPCPHCGHKHELVWENFKIPKDDKGRRLWKDAHMACPSCKGAIMERHKTAMLAGGEWVVTNPDLADRLKRGYQISALYSPIGWKSWAKIAKQWIDAQGNPKKLQAFINNVLAETWKEAGEGGDKDAIIERAKKETYGYDPLLPEGALVLTAAGDVQPDRIEIEVVAWGLGEESWSIDYKVIYGDPNEPLIWQQVELYLKTHYTHPTGVILMPARFFIDSGGANTKAVYNWVADKEHLGYYAIKGLPGDGKPAVGKPSKSNIGGVNLFPLGTFALKDNVMGRLKIDEPGPGYCHFRHDYPEEYFKGITAEEVRTKTNTKGFQVREWHKVYDRNEPFDVRVYNTAAFESLGVNLNQLHEIMNGSYQPDEPERKVRGELSPELA